MSTFLSYKYYNIRIDKKIFIPNDLNNFGAIKTLQKKSDCKSELLIAQRKILLRSEEKYLAIAQGQKKKLLNLIFDEHAEEL